MGQMMKDQFIRELAALLEKYHASISWACSPCSDTHGIYDECMEVDIKGVTVFSALGGCIDSQTLKDN